MKRTESRQVYQSVMGKKKNRILLIVIIFILFLSILALGAGLYIKYSPPELEPMAVKGTPEVSEGYLYDTVQTDFDYIFVMAANLYRQEDGSVNIYLTNPEQNEVSIMCEIMDAVDGTVYYKSGRLLPGEYVENLKPQIDFSNTPHDIKVKVYAFEQDTYLSAGTTELKLVLQAW